MLPGAGSPQIPSHVGEPMKECGDRINVERKAGQDLGPHERYAEPGSKVGDPQSDQPDGVVGAVGQGVDAAQEEARALAPSEVGPALRDHACQQQPVLEQSGRLCLRVAEQSRDVGSGRYRQTARGEPALTALDECGGLVSFGVGAQCPHLIHGR